MDRLSDFINLPDLHFPTLNRYLDWVESLITFEYLVAFLTIVLLHTCYKLLRG